MKHTHKYRRVDIGQPIITKTPEGNRVVHSRKEVWVMKCAEMNCQHYIRMRSKLSCPLLIGQLSICNKCDNKFILDRRALRMSKPTCPDCVDTKKKDEIQDAGKFFDSLMEKINDVG